MNEAEHYGQNESAEEFRGRVEQATEKVEILARWARERENSRGLTYPDLTTPPSAGSKAEVVTVTETIAGLADNEYIERNWQGEKPDRIRRIERIMGLPAQRRPEGIPAERAPIASDNWAKQSSWASAETAAAARQLADALRELERAQALVTQARTLLESLIVGSKAQSDGVENRSPEGVLPDDDVHVVRGRERTTREPDPASHTEAQSGTAGQLGVG